MDNTTKLENDLLRQLRHPSGKSRYSAYHTLNALLNVATMAIYNCSEDKRAGGLALLLDQWQEALRDRVMSLASEPDDPAIAKTKRPSA